MRKIGTEGYILIFHQTITKIFKIYEKVKLSKGNKSYRNNKWRKIMKEIFLQ